MKEAHFSPEALRHYLDVMDHLDANNCRECEEAIRQLLGAGEIAPALQVQAALDGTLPDYRTSIDDAPRTALPSVPGYEVLEVLGTGAMGVVYRARQIGLGREVALKMILHAENAGTDVRERFRTEAQAVGRLAHPHIVQVFEIGEHAGTPFFSMEYCPGGSLGDQLDGTPWDPHRAAALVETLASAMHAAHQAKVVHRDLKPANVLLSAEGQPKVSDFGLAKKLDEAGETQTGVIMGTPSYMAPEQARGQRSQIGPATDVYALGAILYELLTGRPPFKAATTLATLEQVLHADAVPPGRLQPQTPRDLETICLKCLHKEVAKRYPGTDELAVDLRRWRAGEPILARPAGPLERAVKWARRRPAVAALSCLLIAAIAAGVGGILWMYGQAAEERERARNLFEVARAREHEARSQRLAANSLWELPVDPELSTLLAVEAIRTHPTPEAGASLRQALVEMHSRGILRPSGTAPTRVESATFSPDDRLVITAHRGGTARIWDAATGEQVGPPLIGHKGSVSSAQYSRDGRLILTAGWDGLLKLWDSSSRKCVKTFRAGRRLFAAAFSPSGNYIATGDVAGDVQIWDVKEEKMLHILHTRGAMLFSVAFCAGNEDTVVAASNDGVAWVWDWKHHPEQPLEIGGKRGAIYGTALSPDGRQLVTANFDATAVMWDLTGKRESLVLRGHTARVTDVAFSNDGRFIVTASRDTTARVWDTEGNGLAILRGHKEMISTAAFSSDGRSVVTASEDGTARLWQARTDTLRVSLPAHETEVMMAAFDPDGQLVLTASKDHVTHIWDAKSGQEKSPAIAHEGCLCAAGFGRDGRIITAGTDGKARIWEWPAPAGRPSHILAGHRGMIWSARFSPSGDRAVTASADGTVKVWDWAQDRCLATLEGHKRGCYDAVFSPDGRFLVAATYHKARVWDLQSDPPHLVADLHHPPTDVFAATFSPDGSLVGTACNDRIVRVWEWTANPPIARATLHGHTRSVTSVAFHPKNSRFAVSSSADGTARLWDLEMRQALAVLHGHEGHRVNSAVFSPDGRFVLTAAEDGTFQLHPFEAGGPMSALVELARERLDRLRRDFTPEERKKYLWEERPGE
jgi:WD40 repeat protein